MSFEIQPDLLIAGRRIGAGYPPYIVAEMSGNHNGRIEQAFALLEAAKRAGADAVKIQTYTADTLTIDHDSDDFRIKDGLWAGNTLYSLYNEAHTPWDWHKALFEKAKDLGITLFSTPFDDTAVDFLEELDVPAYKIASFECTHIPLIRRVAATGKPLIISTGMACLEEISEAVLEAQNAGAKGLILLHCVSAYPSRPDEANLLTMTYLAKTFEGIVGLSDHSMGIAVSIAAVALGAAVIEKHFTIKRDDGGPDAAFSLEEQELGALVEGCRNAWAAVGKISFERANGEKMNEMFRRSLYVIEDICEGELFTAKNLRSIRPGFGMQPKQFSRILGKRAMRSIKRGSPLHGSMVNFDD